MPHKNPQYVKYFGGPLSIFHVLLATEYFYNNLKWLFIVKTHPHPFPILLPLQDVRNSNILAAKAIADAVRTSLGPRGMDKMIQDEQGGVLVTNDGATILSKMNVVHPAAKMLVGLSKAQDIEAGDGTTSVVVICGALLNAVQGLLSKGIHPTKISESYGKAIDQAEKELEKIGTPVVLTDREALINAARTSLSSKVISQYAELFAPLAVDAVLKVIDPATAENVDLDDVKIVTRVGGTMDDTEMIDGLCFGKGFSKSGGIQTIKNPKIALIQFCLSAPKTDMENSVVISEYDQMDKILREERKYILKMCKWCMGRVWLGGLGGVGGVVGAWCGLGLGQQVLTLCCLVFV